VETLKSRRIAVICGGKSGEREVSLRSGKRVFDSIVAQGLSAVMLDTDDNLVDNLKKEKIDLACIMLHGKYGEDGCIQGLLELCGIPYTGSKVLASALAMNKVASKRVWQAMNIPTPKFFEFGGTQDLTSQCAALKKTFPFPLVIKPASEGSSLGVSILKSAQDLEATVLNTIKEFGPSFAEEYIEGKQVTVGIIKIEGVYKALPILELAPKTEFYDYKAKYTKGMTDFIIPAKLPKMVYSNVSETALAAFNALNCEGFARIDIIVDKDGTPFVHDANTIPGMTDLSDLPAQAQAEGISYDQLVQHILESAL
jgi:D-alanine-D-alanine ligase